MILVNTARPSPLTHGWGVTPIELLKPSSTSLASQCTCTSSSSSGWTLLGCYNHMTTKISSIRSDMSSIMIWISKSSPLACTYSVFFQLETSLHRDILLAGNIYDIDRVQVRFIRHDHNRNQSEHPYTMFGWIMMLGFLLDYISLKHIDQTMASFGMLVSWHNNPRALGSVLIKCLYNGAHSVPKSLVFRQGDRNGSGWSWNVPVYVLNWEHSNDIPPPPV
jgi:hypothetical protein